MFAACDNSAGESGDSNETQTLTSAEFFAELKKRENASIADKKWEKVDVFITTVIDGVTETYNVVGDKIIHMANTASVIKFDMSGSAETFPIFGLSTYDGKITQLRAEKYEKIGNILKCMWDSYDSHDGFSETVECTFDADGYLTEYSLTYTGEDFVTKANARYSNYSGEGIFPDASEGQ